MSEINKIKRVIFPNENKSKVIMALTETKISLKKQFFVFSRYNFHYLRKLFTDLLVDKIKSIVALTILELQLGLSDIFPKSKVCVKTLLVFSYNL